MGDASSLRYAATLPTATGRNKGSVRFNTTTGRPVVSDGTNWLEFGQAATNGFVVSSKQPSSFATEVFFIAPAACKVTGIKEVHSTAGSDAGAVTAVVTKDTGTNAPGAGTSLHQSGSFNLKGTANTVQSATLSTTTATLTLAAGDRLAVKLTGTSTAVAGAVVSVNVVWV